jgi:hypothetical protein
LKLTKENSSITSAPNYTGAQVLTIDGIGVSAVSLTTNELMLI